MRFLIWVGEWVVNFHFVFRTKAAAAHTDRTPSSRSMRSMIKFDFVGLESLFYLSLCFRFLCRKQKKFA